MNSALTRTYAHFAMFGLAVTTLPAQQARMRSPGEPAEGLRSLSSSSYSQAPTPLVITHEMAFYYYVAIYYGAPSGAVVDQYARYFDAGNYSRAMADEFERGRYREGIQARITAQVRDLDFNAKFSFITTRATLGEYSFTDHSFPIVGVARAAGFSYFNYHVAGQGFTLNPFTIENAVNATNFTWSLPMSEADGSALVKSRPDRGVTVRITYSVTRNKVVNRTGRIEFRPFIYSIDVFAGDDQSKKLGVIPKLDPSASSVEELAKRDLAISQILIGTWRDENSVSTYSSDGTRITKWDGGATAKARWSVSNGVLSLVYFEENGRPVPESASMATVLSYTSSTMTIKEASGSIWHNVRQSP